MISAAGPSPSEPVESSESVESNDAEVGSAEPVDSPPPNRAARRARTRSSDPAHVGPRAGRTGQPRSPRSHTKRQIG